MMTSVIVSFVTAGILSVGKGAGR